MESLAVSIRSLPRSTNLSEKVVRSNEHPLTTIKGSLLLEIDLNGCKRLSGRAVRDVWTHSHNMREMHFPHCVELTDLAFPAPHNIRELLPGPNPFPHSTRLFRCYADYLSSLKLLEWAQLIVADWATR
jgi:hypothetical protein